MALQFCKEHGVPVMLKAAYGGGGRGMRVVKTLDEVEEQFQRAKSEAEKASLNLHLRIHFQVHVHNLDENMHRQ